jgi:hypothetical protein
VQAGKFEGQWWSDRARPFRIPYRQYLTGNVTGVRASKEKDGISELFGVFLPKQSFDPI